MNSVIPALLDAAQHSSPSPVANAADHGPHRLRGSRSCGDMSLARNAGSLDASLRWPNIRMCAIRTLRTSRFAPIQSRTRSFISPRGRALPNHSSDADGYFDVNFNGTLESPACASSNGLPWPLSRAAAAGTATARSMKRSLPVDEPQTAATAQSLRGKQGGRRSLVLQASRRRKGLDAIIARPFNHIGRGPGRAVRRAIAGEAGLAAFATIALAGRDRGRKSRRDARSHRTCATSSRRTSRLLETGRGGHVRTTSARDAEVRLSRCSRHPPRSREREGARGDLITQRLRPTVAAAHARRCDQDRGRTPAGRAVISLDATLRDITAIPPRQASRA